MLPLKDFEDNPDALRAYELLETTDQHVFLTGKAGTGKSTFLRNFLEATDKKCAVVAPTGIAALNVNGQTIHSFFLLEPRSYRPFEPGNLYPNYNGPRAKLISKVDIIIIDEISMVRSDLLTAIDMCLKKHMKSALPFGGKQMLFIGDLFQLPPVVNMRKEEDAEVMRLYRSKYFFDAAIDNFEFTTIELQRIYRQQEDERVFIELLNRIRHGQANRKLLDYLNDRVLEALPEKTIILSTINRKVDDINNTELAKLSGDEHTFIGTKSGTFTSKRPGELPAPDRLTLKAGARIMFTKNDLNKQWVNGTLGTVMDFGKEHIEVELDHGKKLKVPQVEWEDNRYKWNDKAKTLDKDTVGTYTQYPLKLAWAITIHKSQGLTFERVVIDLHSGAFDTGQAYVALSRCTTFNGIWLAVPFQERDIMVDERVVDFMRDVLE